MSFDLRKKNLIIIALANPLLFGFTFVGIGFTKDHDNFMLVAFRDKKVVFNKMYKTFGWATRAFKRIFAKEPGKEPEWLDFAYCKNAAGKRGGENA